MTAYRKTYQGFFKPKNPTKYHGNSKNIVYRSSWELKAMKMFDVNPNVVTWASEELSVKYYNPIDNQIHRYFPDFIVKVKDVNGKTKTYMLEVKPYKQTVEPKQQKKTKKFIQESITYEVNKAKWKAASIFCQEQGWEFKLITENELGIN